MLILPRAQKQIDALPNKALAGMVRKLEALKRYPDVSGVRALKGGLKGRFRIRSGDYRIIFEVDGSNVTITAVDDRKDVYDRDPEVRMARAVRDVVTKVSTAKPYPVEAVGFARRSLGAKLRKMRLDADLTQAELARRIRRAPSTVGLAEQGRITVSVAYVEAVIRACGLG